MGKDWIGNQMNIKIKRIYYRSIGIMKEIYHFPKEFQYLYQKMRRGYSNRDLWGLNTFLADIIYRSLVGFKSNYHIKGFPVIDPNDHYQDKNGDWQVREEAEQKWLNALDEMIDGWKFLATEDEYGVVKESFLLAMQKKHGKAKDKNGELLYLKKYNNIRKEKKDKAKLLIDHFDALWD